MPSINFWKYWTTLSFHVEFEIITLKKARKTRRESIFAYMFLVPFLNTQCKMVDIVLYNPSKSFILMS